MAFGLDDAIAAGLAIVNKLIPDPAERARAELEVFRMKQNGDFKEIDASLQLEQEITKRAQADMTSDSWLSKNIRPLIMIYFLTLLTLMAFNLVNPSETFAAMIKEFTLYGLMFYFGGRTLEKTVKMVGEHFGKGN